MRSSWVAGPRCGWLEEPGANLSRSFVTESSRRNRRGGGGGGGPGGRRARAPSGVAGRPVWPPIPGGRGRSLAAPLEDAPALVAERALAALGAAAGRARDALGAPDRLLARVQDAVEHLADRAVLAVERVRVHGDAGAPNSLTTQPVLSGRSAQRACIISYEWAEARVRASHWRMWRPAEAGALI